MEGLNALRFLRSGADREEDEGKKEGFSLNYRTQFIMN
jgi:hypothetical protein